MPPALAIGAEEAHGDDLIDDTRQLAACLALVDGGTQTCAEIKERTERRLCDMRTKIADPTRIKQVLATTAAQCTGNEVPDCPVLEALTA